jgi:hypothetical protein
MEYQEVKEITAQLLLEKKEDNDKIRQLQAAPERISNKPSPRGLTMKISLGS